MKAVRKYFTTAFAFKSFPEAFYFPEELPPISMAGERFYFKY